MPLNINKSDGTLLTTLADRQIDTTTCSLALFGTGAVRYGEQYNENLVKLLENFAADNAPSIPLRGQLWYDTSTNSLKMWNGTDWQTTGAANLAGDVTGTSSGSTIWTTLSNTGVTPGTYTKLSVNAQGRITFGSKFGFQDVVDALGFVPCPCGPTGNSNGNTTGNTTTNANTNGNTIGGTFNATIGLAGDLSGSLTLLPGFNTFNAMIADGVVGTENIAQNAVTRRFQVADSTFTTSNTVLTFAGVANSYILCFVEVDPQTTTGSPPTSLASSLFHNGSLIATNSSTRYMVSATSYHLGDLRYVGHMLATGGTQTITVSKTTAAKASIVAYQFYR